MVQKLSIQAGELAFVHQQAIVDAPTLIFLHDSLGCIKTWRDFPAQLAGQTGCNYLVYDRIGYGESSPDPQARHRKTDYLEVEAMALNELLGRLDISKPILFGHSDGGSIALIAAAQKGNRIAGVIAEAAHVLVEEVTLQGIRNVNDYYPSGLLRNKLLKYHGEKADDVFYSWAHTWLSEEFRGWNIESSLSQISCPCLVIQGEQDEFGSLRQVDSIANKVRGAVQKKIIEKVGHSPHKENSALTLDISSAFVEIIK